MRIALALLLAWIGTSCAAQFNYVVRSTPDSAQVSLNGKYRCSTPCMLKYRWKEAVEGRLVFEVSADGYKSWTDTIAAKPRLFEEKKTVTLDRDIPVFELGPSSPIVGFDKLIADIPEGTVIGSSIDEKGKVEPIKWEGSIKVGESAFEQRFYQIMKQAGVNTSGKQDPKLFSKGDQRTRLPRYLVGMQMTGQTMNLRYDHAKTYGEGSVIGRTTMACEWKVLDRSTGKVVLSVPTDGRSNHRQWRGLVQSDNLLAFEDALVKFLADGRFVELLRSNEATVPLLAEEGKDSAATVHSIEPVTLPAFKDMGEMIRYAEKSCVTVITDAGHGSGVIINSEGYVITAQHVVDGTNRVEVKFSDGLRQDATIVYADVEHDLALLDIAGSGFRPLPLALQDSTGLGDDVVTIGTPADLVLGQSVAKGILSGKRKIDDKVYLQTDLAVNPGNSGGPLLDKNGRVIGIVQSKLIGQGIEGLGFAIPMQEVMLRLRLVEGVPSKKP